MHKDRQKKPQKKQNKETQPMEAEKEEEFVGYVKDADYYFDSYSHFSIH